MLALDAFCKHILASMAALALLVPPDTACAHSKAFEVVYTFTGGNDGRNPHAGAIKDGAGNFYGTTYSGGGGDCSFGCGTVFKIAPDQTETVVHSFTGGSDGQWPYGGLIRDKAGNLYGTTIIGGGIGCQDQGCGTVFKVAPDGTETVLHSFAGGSDGRFPYGDLIRDAKDNLYGTTEQGGTGFKDCTEGFGSGTIFKIAPHGKETILHSFIGSDGCLPDAGLIRDAAGNFYGTTAYGGTGSGGGTVFKFADGKITVLHSFAGAPDGDVPESKLIMDTDGNLYGTTVYGGAKGGGSVFKVASDGTETVLYSFCAKSNCRDGFQPYTGLFMDEKGNLYGATGYGGDTSTDYCSGRNGCGTVFKLAPDGKEKVLYAFTGGSDGVFPVGDLIQDNGGYLYGTAYGDNFCTDDDDLRRSPGSQQQDQTVTCGTVFRLRK